MTQGEADRQMARVEMLCELLADEFDVGVSEFSRLRRQVMKLPDRAREQFARLVAIDRSGVGYDTCGRCRGRGRVVRRA